MNSPAEAPSTTDAESALASIMEVLIGVARGDFAIRAERTYDGSTLDVLAFLANATAEEVDVLVRSLAHEREDLQRARDQLVMREKLAALGELSAGVAHELNQPMTVIRMVTDLLRNRPDATMASCARELGLIADATRRMGRIVESVQAFARSSPLRREILPVKKPFADALVLLNEALHRHGIELEQCVPDDLPVILGDPDRLQQVFVNLLVNARHAVEKLPHGQRRWIRVEAFTKARAVVFRVEDGGAGVAPEHAHRIFDPFFTTKGVGGGTGLGLSVSLGIVSDHGGSLRYEAGERGGACFVLELPLPERATPP